MTWAKPAKLPFPEGGAGAGTGDGAFHARGLFAAGAFIDHQGGTGGEEGEELLFEWVGDALGGVFAYAQADGDVGGGGRDRPEACPTGATYGAALGTPRVSRAHWAARAGRLRSLAAAVAAAFEEVVAVFRADGEQAELGEARVGVEHQAVRGGGQRFEFVPHGEALAQAAAAVLDGGMTQARVGGEQLEVLARAGEHDFGIREGLLGGGEQHAGNRDIRPEGDAGEHQNAPRLVRDGARAAHALVARPRPAPVASIACENRRA